MKRIDEYPMYEKDGIKYRSGNLMPFGATILSDSTVNFSIYSREATYCELLLYRLGADKPFFTLPLSGEFHVGSVYSVMVFGIDWENTEYGYRVDGPQDRSKGYRFDRSKILLDPYAKLVSGREVWRKPTYSKEDAFQLRGRIIREDYDWEGDRPLGTPMRDLIIYELHVRGFTRDKSSGVKRGGTFAGLVEKIPHLKELGVNCVELMPIFESDEIIPMLPGECNYWGYNTSNYFSPKSGYSALGAMGLAADEMKNMVKQLHKAGIEVILDIVFNHTAEYGDEGNYISFRGIDNRTYYVMNPDGSYADLTACRNTVNCNNPIVRSFIIDSLRYWVSDYHIDGFRIDEAPIFARDENGNPMVSPPLVDSLANDPILAHTKFISEGWDPGGHNTIGSFPKGWADWNPRIRDCIRRFIKGAGHEGPVLLKSIEGSPDMFGRGGADISINYVTVHDGFTLYDLVSYNRSRNETNAFAAEDGEDRVDHCSWNCGAEGETEDREVNALRRRQMKNAAALILLSRGVPMLLAGDEFANTQYGNSNAFSQDNHVAYLEWDRLEKYRDVFGFFKTLIAFRKEHPVLRKADFFTGYNSSGYPELSWHGERAWELDMSGPFLTFGFMYAEPAADFGTAKDCFIYCGVNAHWEEHALELPVIPEGMAWRIVAYSGDPDLSRKGEICTEKVVLMPRSLMLLAGSREDRP